MAVVVRQTRTSGSSSTSDATFQAHCSTSDQVGNLVRVVGPKIGAIYQVISCDISNPNFMPAIGIIVSKPTTSTCVVQRFGAAATPGIIAPLITGKRCFVGFDSKPTVTPPLAVNSPTGVAMIQIVGVAIGTNLIELVPNLNMTKVKV